MAFYLVQPYASGPERLKTATVVESVTTVEAAFAELDKIARRLQERGLQSDVIELVVVDEQRQSVKVGN